MVTGNNQVIQPIIELADKSITTIPASECHLSILYKKGGLSFCINRLGSAKVLLLADYQLNSSDSISGIADLLEQFDEEFHSVALSVFTRNYTFVPKPLFDSNDKSALASIFWETNHQPIQEYVHNELEFVVLFQWENQVIQVLTEKFPNIVARPQCVWSIQRIVQDLKRRPGDHLFTQFTGNVFEATAFRNGNLLFNNCFEFESHDDALYHIMNVFEQLKINPDSVPLKITGSVRYKGEFHKLLENYIREVKIERVDDNMLSSVFTKDHGIEYHHMIQMYSCV